MEPYNEYREEYEAQFLSAFASVRERSGVYLERPSLEKLSDFMFGYAVAMYRLTGYRVTFEQKFKRFLFEKYHISAVPRSMCAFLTQGKSEEEGFAAFYQELDDFCGTTGYPKDRNK